MKKNRSHIKSFLPLRKGIRDLVQQIQQPGGLTTFLIPVWIKTYQNKDFKFDLIAGLTVGVMLIPQGMAYAMLAGLPPVYGLYASTVPLIIYALFGTSRQLSVGPVAMDSMLTAAGVSLIAAAGSREYIAIAITLACIVGLMQFGLGVLRLGFLINFLSHPVVQGFTSAAAIIIGLSQLKYMLGIEMISRIQLHDILYSLWINLPDIHFGTFGLGLGALIVLFIFKKYIPTFPAALGVMIISIVLVSIFRWDQQGVSIIGTIPVGLPSIQWPSLNFSLWRQLLPTAFAIAVISFMESISVARAIQARHKSYKVVPNKELMALGLANMGGAFFKSFSVSGGFSRSAVNDLAGARTGFASIISACIVILTLLFLTPLFYFLPHAILAAIILVAIYRLINIPEAKHLWKVDKKDFIMMLVTFLGTLFLGISAGIAVGVLLSLAWIIYEASYPHYAELGRIPGTNAFRNLRRFDNLIVEEGILIFRFDAPLFFANIERFRDLLQQYRTKRKEKIHTIIIDMESINTIDSSAIAVLSEMIDELNQENILLLLTEVKGPVRDKLFKSGLTKQLGENRFFVTIGDALDHVSGSSKDIQTRIALQTNFMSRDPG